MVHTHEWRITTKVIWILLLNLKTCSDDKTIDAVVRNFEIIGEAANKMDPDFMERNPEIEWNRIRLLSHNLKYSI